jgi:S-adenosylmethionine:tRNA ribosyltransferase-isomerase
VLARVADFYRLAFPENLLQVLDRLGSVPLPPYIERAVGSEDEARYQTVYGREPGAVAAPTAGLHFTTALLDRLRDSGIAIAEVTLHVGAGTFQPVRVENINEHVMHAESYHLPEQTLAAIHDTRRRGGRVVAVGTTVVRTLEASAASGDLVAGWNETRIFITPGYQFQVVDALITNFHLPESSLLMLVCAFAGYDRVMDAYRLAVHEGYRFFSYGDAMFLERNHVI